MSVTHLKGHVSRAMDFYNKPDVYFGIGKPTAWTEADRTTATPTTTVIGESYPPTPTNTDELIDPIAYKKVESIFLVRPDPSGELTYRNTKWKIVSYADALSQGARWVYISTFLSYSELPTDIVYRQIAAYTRLVKQVSVPIGQYVLLPGEVTDPGIIEVIDNRKPVYRDPDQREQLVLIVEF